MLSLQCLFCDQDNPEYCMECGFAKRPEIRYPITEACILV